MTSELTTSLRGDPDKAAVDAMILERANTVINLGFIPDWTPAERAGVLDEFRKALRDLPGWAIKRAFSQWVRTHPRRPSPAEIVLLAERAMEPITNELAARRKAADRQAEEKAEMNRRPMTPDQANAICEIGGFTPKHFEAVRNGPCVRTREELAARAITAKVAHWTETEPPDSPKMQALRKSRAKNQLVQDARASRGMSPLSHDK